MNTKAERFELRLDQGLLDKIDEWRAKQGGLPSRAEAVRHFVESGLAASDQSIKPDGFQRLTLWMLSELMKEKRVDPDQKTVSLIQDAIYGGHFWALEWELSGVLHGGNDDKRNVSFVVDTMVMWRHIESSYAKLSDEEKKELEALVPYGGKDPAFSGFDGNNESELMSISDFLINKLSRFEEFKGRYLNSHSPKQVRYHQMLNAYKAVSKDLYGDPMSMKQLAEVLQYD